MALAIGCCVVSTSLAGQTNDVVGLQVGTFEAGILCNPLVLDQVAAPGTVSGTVNVLEDVPGFTVDARQVPAVIGISFGALARAKSVDIPLLDMRVTHPPMGPTGATEQRFTSHMLASDTAPFLYSFEYVDELVLGRWTFEARDGATLVMRFGFDVVAPQDLPELARLCRYEDLIS